MIIKYPNPIPDEALEANVDWPMIYIGGESYSEIDVWGHNLAKALETMYMGKIYILIPDRSYDSKHIETDPKRYDWSITALETTDLAIFHFNKYGSPYTIDQLIELAKWSYKSIVCPLTDGLDKDISWAKSRIDTYAKRFSIPVVKNQTEMICKVTELLDRHYTTENAGPSIDHEEN